MSQPDTTRLGPEALRARILAALSRPPSTVGRRLRTEQALASRLGVSRWQLRDVLQELERMGLLTRQRGSGTYVRRIPSPEEVPAAEAGEDEPGSVISLFAEEAAGREGAVATASASKGQQLHLAVWADLQTLSSTTRAVQAGIIRHLSEEDHRLDIRSFHPYHDVGDMHRATSEFAQQLESGVCDAYVLHEALMPIQRAVAPTLPQRVPVVYFGSPRQALGGETVVWFDAPDAVRRSVHHLADQGFRRIGLVRRWFTGIARGEKHRDLTVLSYRQAMSQLGLDYDAVVWVDAPIAQSGIAAMEGTQELLEGDSPPDALCVTDDHLLAGVQKALTQIGRRPGDEFGVITTSVRGSSLPAGPAWSRMEFDADYLSDLLVHGLLRRLRSADAKLSSVKLCARWCPGDTHRRID